MEMRMTGALAKRAAPSRFLQLVKNDATTRSAAIARTGVRGPFMESQSIRRRVIPSRADGEGSQMTRCCPLRSFASLRMTETAPRSQPADLELSFEVVRLVQNRVDDLHLHLVLAGKEALQRDGQTNGVTVGGSFQLRGLRVAHRKVHHRRALLCFSGDVDLHAQLRRAFRRHAWLAHLDEIPEIALRREDRVALRHDFQSA